MQDEYEFTQDWFTHNIPQWEEFLKPLDGTPCRLLEIGSFEGRSATWMADNLLSHPDSTLTCIDPWTHQSTHGFGGEELFDKNKARCPRGGQIGKIKGYSQDFLRWHRPHFQYDFAYIDGNHESSAVIVDWVYTLPLMKKGGLVCFDDYRWRDPSLQVDVLPEWAIDSITKFWRHCTEMIHRTDQVWMRV